MVTEKQIFDMVGQIKSIYANPEFIKSTQRRDEESLRFVARALWFSCCLYISCHSRDGIYDPRGLMDDIGAMTHGQMSYIDCERAAIDCGYLEPTGNGTYLVHLDAHALFYEGLLDLVMGDTA